MIVARHDTATRALPDTRRSLDEKARERNLNTPWGRPRQARSFAKRSSRRVAIAGTCMSSVLPVLRRDGH
ncbi:hypothetical protein D3260_03150 [Salinisphaera sp. Q1T1-3]|nr:hypothetical protein D3260_03150 [Salinisphaera sp. Q1T1-3]